MRGQKKDPEHMTVEEELRSFLQGATQQGFMNVAEALGRTIIKLQERAAK
jgi:hypothetical protein